MHEGRDKQKNVNGRIVVSMALGVDIMVPDVRFPPEALHEVAALLDMVIASCLLACLGLFLLSSFFPSFFRSFLPLSALRHFPSFPPLGLSIFRAFVSFSFPFALPFLHSGFILCSFLFWNLR